MENQQALEIQKVIHGLLEANSEKEKDDQVKSQIETSIYQIGSKRHDIVIPALLAHLKQPNISRHHKLLILNSISVICSNDKILADTRDEVAFEIIQAAVDSQFDKDTLEIGSDLLVEMSRKYCIEVMKQMLHLFQPGKLPETSTFKTFGRIFSANVFDSIPFLSAILSMLVPLLPEARTDAMKRAVAGAVSQFAEAIVEYVANETDAPDPGVKVSFYQNEFNAVFEYILVNWLPKTRDAEFAAYLLHAISCLARVVSKEKLQEQSERLLSSAVSIIRRFPHEKSASEGLGLTLENLAGKSKVTLENQLDILMDVIFAQTCAPPDYEKPYGVKSHNELLRCFTILYLNFPDRTITFLLNKLNVSLIKSTVQKDAMDRNLVGALTVINKLVNQADVSFSFYLSPLLKTLDPIISPNPTVALSNNVKQCLAHLVLTLADRGYLLQDNSAPPIEFVVRQCAVLPTSTPRSPSGLEVVTDESLRASCENVLHLLTTTVHGMETVLLPRLFDYLLMPQYTEAVRTLTRCLIHLNTKQEVFSTLQNPSLTAVELFTRLFVLAGFMSDVSDEQSVLKLLQLTAVRVSEALKELWEGTTAELEKFLQQSSDAGHTWDPKAWNEVLLKLLETSLKDLKNVEPETIDKIAVSFSRQVGLYTDYPAEKAFLFLALGTTLEVAVDPLLVSRGLDAIFDSVNHSRISERQACASSFGRVASVHFDLILSKLNVFALPSNTGKKSSFMNIFSHKEKTSELDEKMKPTIVLCYGHAVAGCPRALLLTRQEDVLRAVLPYFVGAREFALRHALCRFTELLAKSLKETNSALEKRSVLMFNMKDFVKTESTELRSSVRALAITACAELVRLPPKIAMEELEDALLLFCNGFFPLLPPRHDAGHHLDNLSLESGNSVYMNYEIFWEATFKALKEFMVTMVFIYRSADTALILMKNLKPWLESDSDHERYHSLLMLHDVLQSEMMSEHVLLPVLGSFGGLLATRSMDPDARCRETALACGGKLEAVTLKGGGLLEDWQTASKSCFLKECLTSTSYANTVATLFTRDLEAEQMIKFVRQLYYQGLLEKRAVTATGVGVILRAVFATHWNSIKNHGQDIVAGLLHALKTVSDVQSKAAIEACIQAICLHEASMVAQVLIGQPIPLHPSVSELWRCLGSNPNLAPVLLVHCLDVLRNTPVYAEITNYTRCVSLPVMQSLSVLSELFQAPGNTGLLLANISDFAPVLIVVTAAMVGAKPPRLPTNDPAAGDGGEWKGAYKIQPSKLAVGCLKELLKNTNSTVPISLEMIEDGNMYAEGLHVTTKCLFQSTELDSGRVVQSLEPYLESDVGNQRAAAVAVYAAMLESKRPNEPVLIQKVVASLTSKNSDEAVGVRVFCIRGIGSLSQFGSKIVNENASNITRVILSGLEDHVDGPFTTAPVESMRSLSKILPSIDRHLIQDQLISFAMRLRPAFESSDPMVRSLAFSLFGQIASAADNENVKAAFTDEIHGILIILLLHFNDESAEVSAAIKNVLKQIRSLLRSEGLSNALSYPDGISYSRMLRIICSALNTDFPTKLETYLNHVIGYFKSENPTMRANAVLLAGSLLAQPANENFRTNSGHISPAILQLLSDKDSTVRYRAAESLSLMYQ